jgi:hypothetical protein
MTRREGRLLNISEIIERIPVQSEFADFVQRIVRVRPNLGDIKYVESVGFSILLRHQLDVPGPRRIVALLNT